MIGLFFKVVGVIMAIDILAKYYPKTADIKHPSAKLLEKITEGIVEISSNLYEHFKKLNEEKKDGE